MDGFAIFDMDGTILSGQSQQAFLEYARQKGVLSAWAYAKLMGMFILFRVGILRNPRRMMDYGFAFLNGWEVAKLDLFLDGFFHNVLLHRIFPEAVCLISEHIQQGHTVIVVSNALEPLVKIVCSYLGIHLYAGTRLETNHGRYTGKISGENPYGENKITLIDRIKKNQGIGHKHSWGYGDHASDIFFLRHVDHPHAVNPDGTLRDYAGKHGWPVLHLKLPL